MGNKAKLYKANLNWIVKAEGGQQIMGPTPEDATAAFQALWAQNYPGEECPTIERDETLDFTTPPSAPAASEEGKAPEAPAEAPAEAPKAPETPATPATQAFTLEQVHAALVEGERIQKGYAPAFAHPLLQAEQPPTYEQALEAVRSMEKGLSGTTGREVKLL